ncbi:MAG: YkgJ family cysteine cluster protein [Anaerolineales bacterium]
MHKTFNTNPCLTCGACCAHFRVSFYWSEADPAQGGTVPAEMTQPLPPLRRCMRGTDALQPRCIALEGDIGHAVRCTIYAQRPSPCREFALDWTPDGQLHYTPEDLARCTAARAAWGLPPLLEPDDNLTSLPSQPDPR